MAEDSNSAAPQGVANETAGECAAAMQLFGAGSTGLPACDLSGLDIKDEHLRRALSGQDCLVVDGAMGTQLQERGLDAAEELPELLNLTHPRDVAEIHAAYVAAGAEVITTNTFGANSLKLDGRAGVAEIFAAAADCARAAGAPYIAGDIGPTGALLEPLGTMTFDDAYNLFAEQVDAIVCAGCDLILIETMADLREAKAALLAALERSNLPVFVTMTFGEDGRTFLGTPPEVAAEVLSSMGAHAVGLNCSLGPAELLDAARAMAERVRCPLIVQPNAGLPHMEDGHTVFDVSADDFATAMAEMMNAGASIVGGCCGTSPAYTRQLRQLADSRTTPVARPYVPATVLASAQRAVVLPFGEPQVAVIGERINPTGKPKLKAALRAGDMDYIVGEAVMQQENGADVLDVNVGLPELDEPAVLTAAVDKLSSTVPLPLVIDSSDVEAIEAAVRGYAGKPLINSVNGKRENLDAVLPIVKKYGCAVIGLALDEGGIPPTAEGRFAIAKRIVEEAERYGIPRTDVVIDCLTMACATNQPEAREILRAITLVKERLGCRTALGVSNISFGLPQRNMVNSTFLAAAFGCGLDLPILNPKARRYTDTVNTFRVLNCQDEGAREFIETYAEAVDPYEAPVGGEASSVGASGAASSPSASAAAVSGEAACPIEIPEQFADATDAVRDMVHLIMTGRRGPMGAATEQLLEKHDPLDLVNGVFIPALDVVGEKFDKGAFFLPQLMASAEAVKAGFDVVRLRVGSAGQEASSDRAIAVATVKGDIHDIGKNIVKMLLENYGYRVVDLGRDVDPEEILRVVRDEGIRLVGLSALMTTTVRSMEQTIALLHDQVPDCKVMVGGAVLTPDYAEQINADYYAKDAAESARIAERFFAQ